jgi:hypothetical protein
MTYKIKAHNVMKIVALLLVIIATFSLLNKPALAACAAPTSDYGTDSMTVSAPASGSYVLWTRILVPDTTNNSINAEIDGGTCFNVGGSSSIPSNSWTWVNYQNGVTSTPNTVTLTSGSHTVKLIGTKPGVEVDRIIVTSDTGCVPTGTGDNCVGSTVTDTTPPTVSVTAPTAGDTVSGAAVAVSANASDNVGVAGLQFKLDGSNLGVEDTTSPYSITWDSTQATNGTHNIIAVARDAAGNTTTSSSVTVTTNNVSTCSTSSTSWQNSSFAAQTASFTFDFDATPNANNIDDVTGLSSGPVAAYTDMAVIVHFNAAGTIDAINGASYTSTASVSYSAGTSYHFKLTINPTAHTYSATVTPAGGSAITIATNYPFRSSQATLSSFNNWTLFEDPDSAGTHKVCNAALNQSTGPKTGDINGDNSVNITDLSLLLSSYNQNTTQCTTNNAFKCDLSSPGDGVVNIFDLSILLSHYGT